MDPFQPENLPTHTTYPYNSILAYCPELFIPHSQSSNEGPIEEASESLPFYEEITVHSELSCDGLKQTLKACLPSSFEIIMMTFFFVLVHILAFRVNFGVLMIIGCLFVCHSFLENVAKVLDINIKIDVFQRE